MSKHSKTNQSSRKKTKANKNKTNNSNERKTQGTKEVENEQELTKTVSQNTNSSEGIDENEDTTSPKLDAEKEKASVNNTNLPRDKSSTTARQQESSVLNETGALNDDNSEVIRLSTSNEHSNLSTDQSSRKNAVDLFNTIHSGQVSPILPNRAWSMHCTEAAEKCIVICEMTVHNVNGIGLVPLCIKQIIFDEKMDYEIFLINSKVVIKNKPCVVETISDVMRVIAYTHLLKVCVGGPEVILYGSLNLECAYKDPINRWRHNLCTLEVAEDGVCESCATLNEILQKQVQKSRPLAKRKRAM